MASKVIASPNNVNVTPGQIIPLSTFPAGNAPTEHAVGVENFMINGQASEPELDSTTT